MNFHSINLENATSRLQKLSGDIVSVCLPFGILGIDEKKFAIQRKNTLADLKSQLERKEMSENHFKFFKKIEKFSSALGSEKFQEGLPCTKLYFFNENEGLLLSLKTPLRAHFLISDIAEIEPVYYCESRKEADCYLIDLDLNGCTLLKISAGEHEEVPVLMPTEYAGDANIFLNDTSLKASTLMSDRDHGSGYSTEKSNRSVMTKLTYKEANHEQRNRDYWMRMIGLALSESIEEGVPTYIHGVEYLVTEFKAVNANMLKINDLPIKHKENRSHTELVEALEEARRKPSEDLPRQSALISDTLELNRILESGQCKELLLSENDWFVEAEANQDVYTYSDQRSKLISKALKYGTNIRFVDSNSLNNCSAAALPY